MGSTQAHPLSRQHPLIKRPGHSLCHAQDLALMGVLCICSEWRLSTKMPASLSPDTVHNGQAVGRVQGWFWGRGRTAKSSRAAFLHSVLV